LYAAKQSHLTATTVSKTLLKTLLPMPKAPATDSQPTSFEAGLDELNQLVARMEVGDAPLAEMLASYQRGTALLKFCESQLTAAQQQLLVLDGDTLKPLALP
jgi:exodeoxyribonuclease VII small subunit